MVYGTHRAYKGADGYAASTFRDLDLAVESTVRSLSDHLDKFDFIVVTGISGLSVGAPVALRLNKRLLVLRKRDEQSHGYGGQLLGAEDLDVDSRVLFLDDFVSGGDTQSLCVDAVEHAEPYISESFRDMRKGNGRVVGRYEYTHDSFCWFEPVTS